VSFCDHGIPRFDDESMADHSVRSGSKIPPTGGLIHGVPAPAGTWPDHETSYGASSASFATALTRRAVPKAIHVLAGPRGKDWIKGFIIPNSCFAIFGIRVA
jgi:hypothetical protein